ncbi:MAG: ABC transporter substrate-binding protein [Desulfosudaceae bacterium]
MIKQKLLIAAVVMLAGLVAVSSTTAEEGVTDTEIHIGQTGPLSGPARIWGGTVKGAALRFKMANEAGGIHGRKIIHHTYDDAYNPARTKAGVKRLQESIGMFAWLGGVGTSNGLAVMDYLVQRQIPWVGPFSGSDVWYDPPRKSVFSLYPPYKFEAETLCEYAISEQGHKNIAIVYQDDGYGRNGLAGAEKAVKKYNLNLAAAVPVGRSDIDFSSVVVRLKNAEAEAVLLWISPFSALRLLKVAQQAGLTPQWMTSSSLSSFSTFYPLSHGLVKGLISVNYTTFDKKIVDNFKTAQKKLAPEDNWDTTYGAGIGYADCMVEALERCGRNLTRERFIRALEGIKGYQSMGPAITFASYDPDDPLCRLGARAIYLQQCLEGGQARILTDWIKMNPN